MNLAESTVLAEIIVHLSIRQISTHLVDTSTLKKTFANQEVREALEIYNNDGGYNIRPISRK